MFELILFILYVAVSYLIIILVKNYTENINKHLRLLILSFIYASFWGIGIAANGGDPGFALPAPNIVALGLMASDGLYRGVLSGLIILGFWWIIIIIVMYLKQAKKTDTINLDKNAIKDKSID